MKQEHKRKTNKESMWNVNSESASSAFPERKPHSLGNENSTQWWKSIVASALQQKKKVAHQQDPLLFQYIPLLQVAACSKFSAF